MIYGWKILSVGYYGRLHSPVYPSPWPHDGYLEANNFPDYEVGSRLRGGPGIHAAGSDNLEELTEYVDSNSALVLVQFAGRVYVTKNTEGKTIILGEKARPVLIVTDRYNERIQAAGEFYDISVVMPISKEYATIELKTGHTLELGWPIVSYNDPNWLHDVAPNMAAPNIHDLFKLINRDSLWSIMTIKDDSKIVARVSRSGIEIIDDSHLVARSVGEALLYASTQWDIKPYTLRGTELVPIVLNDEYIVDIYNPTFLLMNNQVIILNSDLSYAYNLSIGARMGPETWIKPDIKDQRKLEEFADTIATNSTTGWAILTIEYNKLFSRSTTTWQHNGNLFKEDKPVLSRIFSYITENKDYLKVEEKIPLYVLNANAALGLFEANYFDKKELIASKILCVIATANNLQKIRNAYDGPVIDLDQLIDIDSISIPLVDPYILLTAPLSSVEYKNPSLIANLVKTTLPEAEDIATFFYGGVQNYSVIDRSNPITGQTSLIIVNEKYKDVFIKDTYSPHHGDEARLAKKKAIIYVLYAHQHILGDIVAYELTEDGLQILNVLDPLEIDTVNPIALIYDNGTIVLGKYPMFKIRWNNTKHITEIDILGPYNDREKELLTQFIEDLGLTLTIHKIR